jgi:four helix bundle protein
VFGVWCLAAGNLSLWCAGVNRARHFDTLQEVELSFLRFEDLRVFKAAEDFADAVWDIVSRWETFAKLTVGKQLARSADSVAANIAEGSGRGASKDNQFVRIARGSLNESKYWLRRASARKLIAPEDQDRLNLMAEAIGPSLNAYLKSLDRSDPDKANT